MAACWRRLTCGRVMGCAWDTTAGSKVISASIQSPCRSPAASSRPNQMLQLTAAALAGAEFVAPRAAAGELVVRPRASLRVLTMGINICGIAERRRAGVWEECLTD